MTIKHLKAIQNLNHLTFGSIPPPFPASSAVSHGQAGSQGRGLNIRYYFDDILMSGNNFLPNAFA